MWQKVAKFKGAEYFRKALYQIIFFNLTITFLISSQIPLSLVELWISKTVHDGDTLQYAKRPNSLSPCCIHAPEIKAQEWKEGLYFPHGHLSELKLLSARLAIDYRFPHRCRKIIYLPIAITQSKGLSLYPVIDNDRIHNPYCIWCVKSEWH